MAGPLSFSQRKHVYSLWKKKTPSSAIARQLSLSPRTVRHLVRAFQERGEAALKPTYRAPAGKSPSVGIEKALLLHEEHPTWGAPYILVRLRQLHPKLRSREKITWSN
jgi:transposase